MPTGNFELRFAHREWFADVFQATAMNLDPCRQLLTPYHSDLIDLVLRNHDLYFETLREDRHAVYGAGARCACVQYNILAECEILWSGHGPLRYCHAADNPQLQFLRVNGPNECVGLRFRKAEPGSIRTNNGSNTDYERALRVSGRIDDGSYLFSGVAPVHLFVVYVETQDAIRPKVERIVITNETPRDFRWAYPIYDVNSVARDRNVSYSFEQTEIYDEDGRTYRFRQKRATAREQDGKDAEEVGGDRAVEGAS